MTLKSNTNSSKRNNQKIWTIHHLRPLSRRGQKWGKNRHPLPWAVHQAWHKLFGLLDIFEIIDVLRILLDIERASQQAQACQIKLLMQNLQAQLSGDKMYRCLLHGVARFQCNSDALKFSRTFLRRIKNSKHWKRVFRNRMSIEHAIYYMRTILEKQCIYNQNELIRLQKKQSKVVSLRKARYASRRQRGCRHAIAV